MKHIIILGDGMADDPASCPRGVTPLEAAHTPTLDSLTAGGRSGLLNTVPEGFAPGSEVANMTVLGYDVGRAFEGRGVLEAASMGVDIKPGVMAMRCNLITITHDGLIKNHSGGHISTDEARTLIDDLSRHLAHEQGLTFHPGVSYRHLLLIDGGDKRISCTPPHDVPGTPASQVMPTALCSEAEPTAERLRQLIKQSQTFLANHPVNLRRMAQGKDPANSIWPWSAGYRPDMEPLSSHYDIADGVVISAVDLIFGIGVYAGLRPIMVEGATGLYDTNYEGKAQAAIEAMRNGADFVFLHVEASDEAGHEGNYDLKVHTIEALDSRIIKPIVKAAAQFDEPVAIAVLPDHPTPCQLRTHTSAPVPFVINSPDIAPDTTCRLTEREAADSGAYGTVEGVNFMNLLMNA